MTGRKLWAQLTVMALAMTLAATPAMAATPCSAAKNHEKGCRNELKGCRRNDVPICLAVRQCNGKTGKDKRSCKRDCRGSCKTRFTDACKNGNTTVCNASPSGAFVYDEGADRDVEARTTGGLPGRVR